MRLFVHKCAACDYLGSDQDHDYYFCRLGVVVARFGNDPLAVHIGGDIARALLESGQNHPLAMAYGVARAAKLVR